MLRSPLSANLEMAYQTLSLAGFPCISRPAVPPSRQNEPETVRMDGSRGPRLTGMEVMIQGPASAPQGSAVTNNQASGGGEWKSRRLWGIQCRFKMNQPQVRQ